MGFPVYEQDLSGCAKTEFRSWEVVTYYLALVVFFSKNRILLGAAETINQDPVIPLAKLRVKNLNIDVPWISVKWIRSEGLRNAY